MNLIQEDNFFPNINEILPQIKKTKLYNLEDFRNVTGRRGVQWPGLRSLSLDLANPILHEYVKLLIHHKKLLEPGLWEIASFIHMKLEDDNTKDWIHSDDNDFAALIYLSDTNLNSGTHLFDNDDNIINDIKFVKNRFVAYSGSIRHVGYGHHGNSIENGRLSINLFINKVK